MLFVCARVLIICPYGSRYRCKYQNKLTNAQSWTKAVFWSDAFAAIVEWEADNPSPERQFWMNRIRNSGVPALESITTPASSEQAPGY